MLYLDKDFNIYGSDESKNSYNYESLYSNIIKEFSVDFVLDCVMKIRQSEEYKTDMLKPLIFSHDKCIIPYISHEDSFTFEIIKNNKDNKDIQSSSKMKMNQFFIQIALLYTSLQGVKLLRIFNECIDITNNRSKILTGIKPLTYFNSLMKSFAIKTFQTNDLQNSRYIITSGFNQLISLNNSLLKKGLFSEGVLKLISPYLLYAYSIYPIAFITMMQQKNKLSLTDKNLEEAFLAAWDSIKI